MPIEHPLLQVSALELARRIRQGEATAVPLGLDARGLPRGIQVAAAHGNDHLTIAVATGLERAFGGWVPPPG